MARILFSAIGTTDPVRDMHDGPWIHCCRYVEPELTIIYLTKEMLANEDKLQCYKRTLDLLNQDRADQGRSPIALDYIRRPELDQPHLSQSLYSDFQKVLEEIHRNYPNDEILINCSSGTPAIKNALTDMELFLPFIKKENLLQVDAPEKGKNYQQRRFDSNADLNEILEYNLDRSGKEPCRMHGWDADQRNILIRAEYAKQLIHNQQYSAAEILLNNDFPHYAEPEKVKHALQGAVRRKMMYLGQAARMLNLAGVNCDKLQADIQSEVKNPVRSCAEMLLTMIYDVKATDYAGMLRKVTPLLFYLTKTHIKRLTGFDVDQYTNEKGFYKWPELENDKPDIAALIKEGKSYTPLYPATSNLIPIIRKYDPSLKADLIEALRSVEDKARNKAAHTIQGIDDDWILDKTEKTSEEIIRLFKQLIYEIDPDYGEGFWQSYERMNEGICGLLRLTDA